MSFITSNKGKPLLVRDSYIYYVSKTTATVKYWRCEDRSCNAGVHTSNKDVFIKTVGIHSHLQSPEEIEVRTFHQNIKRRVINETTAITKIYDEELARQQMSQTAAAIMPSSYEANSGLNRARRKMTPVLPTSYVFDIPAQYQVTLNDEQFLLCDKTLHNKRLLLFGTDQQLIFLFSAKHILMDGTFDTCPPYFDQVYTIHAIKHEKGYPCVIGLLCNRKARTYRELFRELKHHATRLKTTFNPNTITSDFEKALIKAVADEFPQARHAGCYFHFTQALYRNIQKLGLSTAYRDTEAIRMICRKLMALPLLPLNDVKVALEDLKDDSPITLRDLFNYFENFWMADIPVHLWNVSDLQIRTNNNCEGWHNRFNIRVNKHHPNIWHFINCLKQEEVYFRHQIIQMRAGATGRPKTKRTNCVQRRITTLTDHYANNEINLGEYLDGFTFRFRLSTIELARVASVFCYRSTVDKERIYKQTCLCMMSASAKASGDFSRYCQGGYVVPSVQPVYYSQSRTIELSYR
ncbi:unnamed protein product [Rotaria magnacalcarata]